MTGATGLNGSYMVKALSERGAKVRAVVHQRPPTEFTKMAEATVKADLTNADSTREALRGAEIVVHAAGIAGGASLAVDDPGAMVAPNAVINSQVIHACSREKVERLGFLSSTAVYPPSDEAVREEDAWKGEPYEMYFGLAWVKRFSEKLCQFYSAKTDLKVAIVRPSGSYGRYDNFDERTSHALGAILMRAISGANPLKVWGDGGDVRDYVHASDIAQGLLLALEKYAVCDPINIASGHAVTTKELAELAVELTGGRSRLEFDASKPSALRVRRVDISKARRLLGYAPKVSLRDGLKDIIEWYSARA